MNFKGGILSILVVLVGFKSFTQVNQESADTTLLSAYYQKGVDFRYQYPDSAYFYAQKVLELSRELENIEYEAQAWLLFGIHHVIKGEHIDALRANLTCLELARSIKDSSTVLVAYNNIGDSHMRIGNYEEAYHYFLETELLSEQLNDELLNAISTFNMGLILTKLHQYDSAQSKFRQSFNKSLEAGDVLGEAYVFSQYGNIYTKKGLYDSALYYLDTAEKISKDENETDLQSEILEFKALAFSSLGQYDKALEVLDKSLMLAENISNAKLQVRLKNTKASIYIKTGNLGLAETTCLESVELSKKNNYGNTLAESYKILSIIHEEKGKFNSSLNYFKQYQHVKDSIQAKVSFSKISTLQLQNELQKRNFEILYLNNLENERAQQIKKQESLRNILIIALAIMSVILIGLFRSDTRRRKANRLLDVSRKEAEEKNEELRELNKLKEKLISILAHDLRSPIRSLSGILDLTVNEHLTEEESKKLLRNVKTRTDHTSRLLDNLLEWALLQMDRVTVTKSVFDISELVTENIELMQETGSKEIEFINKVCSVNVRADRNMIDLAMRNIISNAVKFTESGGQVTISCLDREKDIIVKIKDNGIGMSEEEKTRIFDEKNVISKSGTSNEQGTGLGIKLSKEFIEKNGGSIWVDSELNVGSTFSFSLTKK